MAEVAFYLDCFEVDRASGCFRLDGVGASASVPEKNASVAELKAPEPYAPLPVAPSTWSKKKYYPLVATEPVKRSGQVEGSQCL